MPQKSRTKPPMERIKADISCKSSLINRVIFQNFMQIYTKKGTICKFSSQFSAKLLPSISEEGVNIGFRYRLAGDFAEAVHQQLQVLGRNVLPCPMVESVMDFLCSHSD